MAGWEPQIPVDSPSLDGVPFLALAHADLDGDGFVGITHLDGDLLDDAIEEAELTPVARGWGVAVAGQGAGTLPIPAGGPPGAPLRVFVGAAAYAGVLDPAYMAGVFPDGPAVMTKLPAVPRTDPARVFDFGGGGLNPPVPGGLLAVELEPAHQPDPSSQVRERFTVRLDGSEHSVDLAEMVSGGFSRIGVGQRPDPALFHALEVRPIRPGLDAAGTRVPYEILQRLFVADDGSASSVLVRLLPLDRLGNITAPPGAQSVVVSTGGVVRIVSPDADGDPFRETISVDTVAGSAVELDDGGGAHDGADADLLVVRGASSGLAIPVHLPDPDPTDDGVVTVADVNLVASLAGLRAGEFGFEPRSDLDGNGEIDALDEQIVSAHLGSVVAVP